MVQHWLTSAACSLWVQLDGVVGGAWLCGMWGGSVSKRRAISRRGWPQTETPGLRRLYLRTTGTSPELPGCCSAEKRMVLLDQSWWLMQSRLPEPRAAMMNLLHVVKPVLLIQSIPDANIKGNHLMALFLFKIHFNHVEQQMGCTRNVNHLAIICELVI